MARLYRFSCLFALLFGSLMALQAQDLRSRDDDGGRPEEDNISGYHYSPSDYVLNHSAQTVNSTSGQQGHDEGSGSNDPQRQKPGAIDLDKTLSVYPNPVSSVLFLELDDALDVTVTLHSLVGKEVYRFQGRVDTHRIRVDDFQPGIYFVRLTFGDEQVVRKLKIMH